MSVGREPGTDVYADKVYCSTCCVYFKKPYPRWCLCCRAQVRNVRSKKPNRKIYDYSYGIIRSPSSQWIKKDILAAQKAGRL